MRTCLPGRSPTGNLHGMASLRVNELQKSFPTPTDPLVVLNGVSFELDAGESLAVVGPSGSGKSTLLHIVGTLDTPTAGTVSLGDTDPFQLPPKELAAFRNDQIGFVFQEHHLLPQLSVRENVLLPVLAHHNVAEEHQQRASELIERVGLANRATHRPAELSGGERQRVAVARALLMQPRLILADEPTGNLDEANAIRIVELLGELQQSLPETMLIVVTHSPHIANHMQRQMAMHLGKLQVSAAK